MTRRLQLLDPESRASGRGASAVLGRIRDGLLRDNKVVPAVLGVLALLIFTWLVAGAIIGGAGDEEEQQASNQASLAQGEDAESGDTETPAPGVENRDSDASYGGFDEPKDPFELPEGLSKAGDGDGDDGGGDGDGGNGNGGNGNGNGGGGDENDRNGGGTSDQDDDDEGGDGAGSGGGDDDEDFIRQRPPGGASQGGATGQGSPGQGAPGQQGGAGQSGNGLFNSGGDLPAP